MVACLFIVADWSFDGALHSFLMVVNSFSMLCNLEVWLTGWQRDSVWHVVKFQRKIHADKGPDWNSLTVYAKFP